MFQPDLATNKRLSLNTWLQNFTFIFEILKVT